MTCQQLMLDYLWHLQSIVRCMQGRDRDIAVARIKELKSHPKMVGGKQTLNIKSWVWYWTFATAPKLIARVRNVLKIGL